MTSIYLAFFKGGISPRKRNFISWISMLFFGLVWGATIPLSKIATSSGYPPLGLVVWELVFMIILLGSILNLKGWSLNLNKDAIVYYVIIAFLGALIPNTVSYLALTQLPAGVVAILIATAPMFTLLIAILIKTEDFSTLRILGILAGFFAIATLYLPHTNLPDAAKAIFMLAALVAAFCDATEANYIACKTPPDTEPISTLFMASCIGLCIIIPITLTSGQWITPPDKLGVPEYALILSSLLHAFAYVGYIWLVGFGGPVFSVQISYPVTLSGVFFSILFLHETYSIWIWFSLMLVILALFMVQPSAEQLAEEKPY